MLRETRLHRIQSLVSTLQQVSTERLIKELGISRETARRDIIELEAMGLVRRVHGGLVAIDAQPEPPLTVRAALLAKEKRAIATAAVRQLRSGQTVFIDGGSTTTLLADELRSMSGLTILTNSLQAALRLSAAEGQETMTHQVILIGGSMQPAREQTGGEVAVGEIYRYRADVAIISPVGIDAKNGASSFLPQEAAIARAMVSQAEKLFILADHSKLGVTSRVTWAVPADISLLITDIAAGESLALKALQATLPEVILA